MYIDPTLTEWHASWEQDLIEAKQSPTTIRSQSAAIGAFLSWTAELPDPPTATSLTFAVFEAYIQYLKEDRIPIQQKRHITATNKAGQTPLKPTSQTRLKKPRALKQSSIRAYIGSLTRWLQWLSKKGYLTTIPDKKGNNLAPTDVGERLGRMLNKPKPLVAPRMPDLRRLPGYYDLALHMFLREQGGVPGRKPLEVYRAYLNLLRNRALIATLFSSGGRISEVLSLDVSVVLDDDEEIADLAPISGKGRRERSLRLDAVARDWIVEYLRARAESYPRATAIFISHGPKANGKAMSPLSAQRVVKEAAMWLADLRKTEGAPKQEVADIRATSPHSLRHFFAQALLDEDVDYVDIATLLGHSSTAVTEQVYARRDEARAHETANARAPRAVLPSDDQMTEVDG